MTDHEIMYTQTLEHVGQDVAESSVQAYCSCNWQSAAADSRDEVDAEAGEHLYLCGQAD